MRDVAPRRRRRGHHRQRRPRAHRADGRARPPRLRPRGAGGRARHQDRHADPLREPARGRRRSHRQRRRRVRVGQGRRHRGRLRHRDDLRLRHAQGRVPRRRHRARHPDQRRRALLARRASCRASRSRSRRRSSAGTPSHSMQSGIVYGYVGLVDGLVERLHRASSASPRAVIATGGLARAHRAAVARPSSEVDDDLTLTGLRILYERNAPEPAAPPAHRSSSRRGLALAVVSSCSASRSASGSARSLGDLSLGACRPAIALILVDVRLPRVLLAASRARGSPSSARRSRRSSRNPLAEPYVLGVSGGAALGATLALVLGGWRPACSARAACPLAAFARRGLAALRRVALARCAGRATGTSILLAGVVVNAMARRRDHVPQDARRAGDRRRSSSAGSRAFSTSRSLGSLRSWRSTSPSARPCSCATRRASTCWRSATSRREPRARRARARAPHLPRVRRSWSARS